MRQSSSKQYQQVRQWLADPEVVEATRSSDREAAERMAKAASSSSGGLQLAMQQLGGRPQKQSRLQLARA